MIQKVLVFLVLSILIPSAVLSAPKTGVIKVACVGDSITYGAGIRGRKKPDRSYPKQMAEMLGDKWEVKNFGVNSATLLKSGNKPYWKLSKYTQAMEFNPDIVIIKLGTNDSKKKNWAQKDKYIPDYIEMVKSFQNLKSKPQVWICYPVPVYEGGRWTITDQVVKDMQPMIDKVAKTTGAQVIDLYKALSDKPEMFPDRIHPNADGAKVMAETIAAAIRKKK